MTAYHLEMKLDHTVSFWNELVRDAYHAGKTSIESAWCGNMNKYRYNTYRVIRADKWHDSISSRDEIGSYRIVSKRTRAGCISCGTNKQNHQYISLQFTSSDSCRQMTWQHIVSRWTCIIPYRVEMNSCGMHIMRDKDVWRVLCGNMNTYRYKSHRVFRPDKGHDSISSRDELVSYRIVSKRSRAGCIWCGTNTYQGCLLRKHEYISLQYISSVSCRQFETNDMTAYRLEMKMYYTVSCRNELVRDAYHAGQTSIKKLVLKHKYISYTHRVIRANKWHDSISSRNEIEMKMDHTLSCQNSCGKHMMRYNHVSRAWCWNMITYCYNTHRVFRADKLHDSISSRDEIGPYRILL
jgi:hypothetical protein